VKGRPQNAKKMSYFKRGLYFNPKKDTDGRKGAWWLTAPFGWGKGGLLISPIKSWGNQKLVSSGEGVGWKKALIRGLRGGTGGGKKNGKNLRLKFIFGVRGGMQKRIP